jgi:L-2-hydroxyglutarate oxidase LhgO
MQVIVIGAGIVGLHVANVLQEQGHEIFVLEKMPYLAEHTSGRNSGVIHAGIFYQTGSFKEEVCIDGNVRTYEWLKKLKVPHKACGKWVVPELGQEDQMEVFYEKVRALPIPEARLLSADEVHAQEPALRKTRGILIPSTGILDAASYVKAFATYLENMGVHILLNCLVKEVDANKLQTSRGEIEFDLAINSAGLFSDELAALSGLHDYTIKPCRGDYYVMNQCPVSKPVYHLPYQGAHGLGVHLTPTVDGQTILGPNAFFIEDKNDYVHRSSVEAYEKAITFYLPDIEKPSLQEAYSGNRPKLFFKGGALPEFTIVQQDAWIHLLGIESPGLTAAPALAKRVAKLF